MKVIELERPNCPLEMLAMYLIKHQGEVKLPEKPPAPEIVEEEI
jgi:hypothetical protein